MIQSFEFDPIPDESDRASVEEAVCTQEAIRKHMESKERVPDDFDGVHCVECGEPIPAKRLATGAFRDIECQIVFEAKLKRFVKR